MLKLMLKLMMKLMLKLMMKLMMKLMLKLMLKLMIKLMLAILLELICWSRKCPNCFFLFAAWIEDMSSDGPCNFGHTLQVWNNRCFVIWPSERWSTSWTTSDAAEAALKAAVPPLIWYAAHRACSKFAGAQTKSRPPRHTSARLENKVLRHTTV